MVDVTAWLVSLLVLLAPPERLAAAPALPGWAETTQERTARYEAIAADLAAVVFDPGVRPVYGGPEGRARTATLVLALAYMESGFAPDVDQGPCYRGPPGSKLHGRCDGGLSACLLQIRLGAGTTREGWTQQDLFADRRKCFTAGLRLVRQSTRAAQRAGLGEDDLLRVYASGSVSRGAKESKVRLALARKLIARGGLPANDGNLFVIPLSPESSPPPANDAALSLGVAR
jgi:hypothetical protein